MKNYNITQILKCTERSVIRVLYVRPKWLSMIRLPSSGRIVNRPAALILSFLLWNLSGAEWLRGEDFTRLSNNWVATDALGRHLPVHRETGDRRPGKFVGIFYFVWVGNHTPKVYDITKILKVPEEERQWGPYKATHFGCEPEYSYFHSSDPWVIRRDMQMLVNAGVDFLFLDVTNGLIYEESVDALLGVIRAMRDKGIHAPGVVFTTNGGGGATINRIHDRFYKDGQHEDLWFQWDGKPVIFGTKDDPKIREELKDYFTIKRSWAWTATKTEPDHWQWLDTSPQDYGWSASPDIPEQIPVTAASHATNSIGRSYHDGAQPPVGPDYLTEFTSQGLHFEEQWKRAHEVVRRSS